MSENRKVFLRGTRKVFLHFCKKPGKYFLQGIREVFLHFCKGSGKICRKKRQPPCTAQRRHMVADLIKFLLFSVPGHVSARTIRQADCSAKVPSRIRICPRSGIRRRHPGSSYLTTPRLLNGQTQKTSSPTIWSSATQPTEALRESTDTLRWSPKTNIRFSGTW